MKNFIKKISVYMTVCMCLFSMAVIAVPGFAASDVVITPTDMQMQYSPDYLTISSDSVNDGNYSGVCYLAVWLELPPGRYYCTGTALESGAQAALQVGVLNPEGDFLYPVAFDSFVTLTDDAYAVVAQSHAVQPVLYRVVEDADDSQGLYYSAYDILKEAFYGDVELTDAQDITLTLMATLAALVVIALPFVLLFGIISMCGRWR